MEKCVKKVLSVMLSAILVLSCIPGVAVFADSLIEIYNGDTAVTEKISLQEYRSVTLTSVLSDAAPENCTVGWVSNLPLLADVDDSGKVTAYDYSKRAIIQLWIDEKIAPLPIIGASTADAIWKAIDSTGIDVDNTDTDTLVTIVSTVVGEEIGETLRTYLNNMNVKITATLYSQSGEVLGSDTVEVVVEKSLVASVAPTGVHITNKKVVPKTVAVGSTVQLLGACTPVRLGQGIKWTVGKNAFDTSAKDYADVSADGLVTFKKSGTVTVRVNPSSDLYAAFSDTVTFTVLEQSMLPVTDFTIAGSSSVAEGATTQLAVSDVVPAGAYKGDLKWSSSDPSIAVIDENGLVTGLDGGSGLTYSKSVLITATMGGCVKEFTLKVTRSIVSTISSVEITGNSTVGVGASETLTSTVYPARLNTSSSVKREWGIYDAASGEPVFASAGSPVTDGFISIDADGNLTGVAAGVSKVYIKATYGGSSVYSEMDIICGKAITDFTIDGTLTLTEGKSSLLTINVTAPTDYEQELLKNVKWTIDNDSVATVSENGTLFARDAGGRSSFSSATATVTATVSGVTRTATVTVKGQGTLAVNKYTDAQIDGNDCVIVDLPRTYSMTTYPARIGSTTTAFGLNKDDGSAPWTASQTMDTASANLVNSHATVSADGTLKGLKSGTVELYGYKSNLLSTYIEAKRSIDVIEVVPNSITLKAPSKTQYLEGDTELDLSGLEVYLNYNKGDIAEYYPDAADYTEAQLTAQVTDYTVSKINTDVLDTAQYIIVSVTRAGKTMNAVFEVTVQSKALESLTLTAPEKSEYIEGNTELDLTGLTVTANYSNAESELVTDYEVDYTTYNPSLFDTEQNVTVRYTHAGRTAESTFPVTVYGIPDISVSVDGVTGEWTSENVVFNFSSTHALDEAKYYFRTEGSDSWVMAYKNSYTVKTDTDKVYYFKAINSKGIESAESEAFTVKIDKTAPSFDFSQSITSVTNQSYNINIYNITYGISGLKSFTLDGAELDGKTEFEVSENGKHTVVLTAGNGLSLTRVIDVENIDKEAPRITSVTITQDPTDAASRFIDTDKFGKYYSGNVVATAEAEDVGVAGIKEIKYRLVNSEYEGVTDWAVYNETDKAVCSTEFKGYFEFVAVDYAGNESEPYYTFGFTRDGVNPVINNIAATSGGEEYVNDSWAADAVRFTPEASAFSGVYEYLYRMDSGDWKTFSTEYLEVTDDGTHTYFFKAVSYSGLESDEYEFTVNIDRVVPMIRVDFEGTFGRWTSEDVTFTLSTLNTCPSGVTYYYDCGDGWVKIDGDTAVFNTDTNAYYRFKAVNGAGLESTPSDSYLVKIDALEPTAEIIRGVTDKTSIPYDIAIVPITGGSGVKKVYFDGEDVTETLKATVHKNGRYILTIIGNNLLSSSIAVEITNFGYIPSQLYTYTVVDGENADITAYNGTAEILKIPSELDNHSVTSISNGAFSGNTKIKEITIPAGVTTIGAVSFMNCTSLEKLTIPESVTAIDKYAFTGCENLTIYCYEGSFAESFAKENNIPYVYIDIKPVGNTEIDTYASVIYTSNTLSDDTTKIVSSSDGYDVVGVASLVDGDKKLYGTGSTLYFFKDGQLMYTYKVVVRGDLNGDSVTDALDVMLSNSALTENSYLYDEYLLAADFDGTGEVEAEDYQRIVNVAIKA